MPLAEDMGRLADEIQGWNPAFKTDLVTFPSGAAMLDVRYRYRLFVMVYSPSSGFGVDEVRPGEGLGTGYRHRFRDFPPAKSKLLRTLAEASGTKMEQER
jgi:hypothetical protein